MDRGKANGARGDMQTIAMALTSYMTAEGELPVVNEPAEVVKLELSEREGELLRYLALNRGRIISREELLTRVWKLPARGVRTRTIDVHVARLREKLRDTGGQPQVILTVRGKGYRFVGEGGQLIAETLAAAGGEDDEDVAACHGVVDDLPLHRAEGLVAEV